MRTSSSCRAVVVRGLSAVLDGSRVLDTVDLDLPRGAVVALLGAHGSGKTALAQCLAGLVRPDTGSVELDGIPVTGWRPRRIARAGLRYVPAAPAVFASLSVSEHLQLGGRGLHRRELSDRAEWVCGVLSLQLADADQLAMTLSGGEQQLLAIATALMAGPRYLVLDEPSIGLSDAALDRLANSLQQIADDGVGVLRIEERPSTLRDGEDVTLLLDAGGVTAAAG